MMKIKMIVYNNKIEIYITKNDQCKLIRKNILIMLIIKKHANLITIYVNLLKKTKRIITSYHRKFIIEVERNIMPKLNTIHKNKKII